MRNSLLTARGPMHRRACVLARGCCTQRGHDAFRGVYIMSRYSRPVRVRRHAYRPAHALRDEGVLRRPAVRPHAPGWYAVTPRLALAHRAC